MKHKCHAWANYQWCFGAVLSHFSGVTRPLLWQTERGTQPVERGEGQKPNFRALIVTLAGAGHDGRGEAELGGFLQPLIHVAECAHAPGEAHLAEIDSVFGHGTMRKGGEERGRCSEVGGRVAEPQAACDI